VGTCKMGTQDDCVVDPQLMVRGFENLRVADASVIPEIVCANTNAPAMMIGWRVAEMISGRST
jgi:choline dehydrogenase